MKKKKANKQEELKLWLTCRIVKLTSVRTQTHRWLITRHDSYQCTGCSEAGGQNTAVVTRKCVTVSSHVAALFLSLPELSLIPSDSRNQPYTRIDKPSKLAAVQQIHEGESSLPRNVRAGVYKTKGSQHWGPHIYRSVHTTKNGFPKSSFFLAIISELIKADTDRCFFVIAPSTAVL